MSRIRASFLTFVLLLLAMISDAQKTEHFNLIGLIVINDTFSMSYRVVLDIQNTLVSGYSITDFQGPDETKTSILGEYNYSSKSLKFSETELTYTKSAYETNLCYIYANCALSSKNRKATLQGTFIGKFRNGDTCAGGNISLLSTSYVVKKLEKVEKLSEVVTKDTVARNIRAEINKIDDKRTTITSNQSIKYKWSSKRVDVVLWDQGIEDGDIINLKVNGTIRLKEYRLSNSKKTVPIVLSEGENIIEVEALNTGSSFPNTVTLLLTDGTKSYELVSVLNSHQKASIVIIPEI